MSELNAKLDINAKELEISRLENEKALQKASWVRLGIYMGVIIIILFIIILMLQYKRKIQRKESEDVRLGKVVTYDYGDEDEQHIFSYENGLMSKYTYDNDKNITCIKISVPYEVYS